MARDLATNGRERVLHVWRHDVVGLAKNKTIGLQGLQRLRQHAFADASNRSPQRAKPQGLVAQADQDQHPPSAGDVI